MDFDIKEWMEEQRVKCGDSWTALRGKPKQEFCDIRISGGKEIGPCWPRSLMFVDLSSEDEDHISFKDVTHVRYYEEVAGAEIPHDDEDDSEEKEE